MLPAGDQLVTSRQHHYCCTPQAVTQSSVPEDGRNYRTKRIQLILIINRIIVASSWLFILLYH